MNILRKFALLVACSLLPAALLTFAALFSIHQVFGSSDHIKHALDQSKIYDSVAASLIQQNTTNSEDTNRDQAAVQKAIQDAVPPQYLKDQTNNVLDGVFAWLQGDSKQLAFSIDLTPVKANLVTSLTEQAKARAQSLPACTSDSGINLTGDDPFSMECLPPGVSPDTVADRAKEQVLNSDIFKNSAVTPETISKDQGESLQKQLEPTARIYKAIWQGTLIAGISALLFTAAIVALSRPWQSGVKRTSVIFLSIGISNVALGLVAAWVAKTLSKKLTEDGTLLQAKLAEVVRLLSSDLRNWWVGFGITLSALGIAGLVIIRVKKVVPPAPDAGQAIPPEPITGTNTKPVEHKNGHNGPVITN